MTVRFINTGSDAATASVVLHGAPFDTTVAVRKGCRWGPQRIRTVSHVLEEFSLPLADGYRPEEVCDAGDVNLSGRTVAEILDLIRDITLQVGKSGQRALWLGGEHTLTLATVTALHKIYPDLAVVIMDAHADLRADYNGHTTSHASVVRRLTEVINPQSILQVGVRSGTADELQFQREQRIKWVCMDESGICQIVQLATSRPIYLSIDIDVVDPAHAPGTGSPEPGGVSATTLLNVLTRMSNLNFVGGDLVEVSPIHDCSDITSLLAARLVRDMCVIMRQRPET